MQIFFNLIMDLKKELLSYSGIALFFIKPLIKMRYYIKFNIFIFLYIRKTPIEQLLLSYASFLNIFLKNEEASILDELNPSYLFKIAASFDEKNDYDIIGDVYTFYNIDDFGNRNGINFILHQSRSESNKYNLLIDIYENGNISISFDFLNTKNPLYIYYKIEIVKYIKQCMTIALKQIASSYISEA